MITTIPVYSKYFTMIAKKYHKHSSGESDYSKSITYSSYGPASGTLSTILSMQHKGISLVIQSLRWSHPHLHQSIHHTHLPAHILIHFLHTLSYLHEGRWDNLHFLCAFGNHLCILCFMVNSWFCWCKRLGYVRQERVSE